MGGLTQDLHRSRTIHVDEVTARSFRGSRIFGKAMLGDRDLIEAIANLVDNAVKFTPAGGQVEIGLFRGNGENIVRVKTPVLA
jgi:signal transduction histidine kinase